MLNDLSRDLVAKHQDHENRFATNGVFKGKLVDEIDLSCREDDANLQETTRDLDTQFSEHLIALKKRSCVSVTNMKIQWCQTQPFSLKSLVVQGHHVMRIV